MTFMSSAVVPLMLDAGVTISLHRGNLNKHTQKQHVRVQGFVQPSASATYNSNETQTQGLDGTLPSEHVRATELVIKQPTNFL